MRTLKRLMVAMAYWAVANVDVANGIARRRRELA
jgi:hypothetical protein